MAAGDSMDELGKEGRKSSHDGVRDSSSADRQEMEKPMANSNQILADGLVSGDSENQGRLVQDPHDCAKVLKVLADSTRLRIVQLLFSGPKVVSEINQALQVEQTLLSHHLKVLRESGILESQRKGKSVCYELSDAVKLQLSEKELNFGCCKISFND